MSVPGCLCAAGGWHGLKGSARFYGHVYCLVAFISAAPTFMLN